MTTDELAEIIWRETYRHDTLLSWSEIRPGTMHHKRVKAAALAALSSSQDIGVERAALDAADYLIERLRLCHGGKAVRDLEEANMAYDVARAAAASPPIQYAIIHAPADSMDVQPITMPPEIAAVVDRSLAKLPPAQPVDEGLINRLSQMADDLESEETELSWLAGLKHPRSATRLAIAADLRAILAARTPAMPQPVDGEVERIVKKLAEAVLGYQRRMGLNEEEAAEDAGGMAEEFEPIVRAILASRGDLFARNANKSGAYVKGLEDARQIVEAMGDIGTWGAIKGELHRELCALIQSSQGGDGK